MESLLIRSKSHICSALLKYSYSNFSLTILEYCEVSDLLIREKHYWNILQPEYNIAKEPGAPMSGRNHSPETKQKMSDAQKGEKNHRYGKARSLGAGTPSQQIEVFDLQEKTITSYNSFSEAARALNFPSHQKISDYIRNNQVKPYKGRYIFKVEKK
jgi:hypothetical protein